MGGGGRGGVFEGVLLVAVALRGLEGSMTQMTGPFDFD
jgi:hypothetical protein